MKKVISIAVVLLLLSGCTTSQNQASDKYEIMTTYYPYQLVIEELAGDFVDVESIYPEDSDAHSYELTPKQTIAMQDADLVVITNASEDSKIYDTLENKDNLLVLEEPKPNESLEDAHLHSHSWLSPNEMIESVETISDALVDLDDTNKAVYRQNAATLTTSLEAIDAEYTAFGASQTKPIIATHDAYESLTDDYGIEFITLYGQHHDDEPTTNQIISTVDLINEQDINTIFVEQDDTANPVMRQIADETSSNVETIYTLETKSSHKKFNSITDFYDYNLQMMEKGQS